MKSFLIAILLILTSFYISTETPQTGKMLLAAHNDGSDLLSDTINYANRKLLDISAHG